MRTLLVFVFVSLCISCTTTSPRSATPDEGVALTALDTLDRERLQAVAHPLPGNVQVANGVGLFRLVYRSEVKGTPVLASALVAVPQTATSKGVVLSLRGSDIPRAAAPTTPGAVWLDDAAVFAGNGYTLLLPDYLGMGASPSPQAFLLTQVNVEDFRRALTALRVALRREERQDLFIVGFSQGAQLTAAMQRDLEQRALPGFALRATTAGAGPHELVTSLRRRLQGPLTEDLTAIGYVGWAAFTFAWFEGHSLDTVFAPPFVAKAPRWFGGELTIADIAPELPLKTTQMLGTAFVTSALSDEQFWFNRMLRANETWKWVPVAPLEVLVGDADDHVDPESTRALYEFAQTHGGNVSLQVLPGLKHQDVGAATYSLALAWFEQHR